MASPSDRAYLAGTACTVRSRNPPDTHWENLGAFPANFATELNGAYAAGFAFEDLLVAMPGNESMGIAAVGARQAGQPRGILNRFDSLITRSTLSYQPCGAYSSEWR